MILWTKQTHVFFFIVVLFNNFPFKHGEPIKRLPVNPKWLSSIKAPYYLWVVAISPIISGLSPDRPLMVMVGLTPRPC